MESADINGPEHVHHCGRCGKPEKRTRADAPMRLNKCCRLKPAPTPNKKGVKNGGK